MDSQYIDEVNRAYEAFFGDSHQGVPVLRVDTNELNYVAREDDLKWIGNRIRQALQWAPFQPELPLNRGISEK